MSKSAKDMTDQEWNEFMNDFIDLLKKHNVAGSVGAYSFYRALQEERAKDQVQLAYQNYLLKEDTN